MAYPQDHCSVAGLSQVIIPVIPTASLSSPLNTWNCFSLPRNGYYFPSEIIHVNSFSLFPVSAGESSTPNFPTGLALSRRFPNIVKRKKDREKQTQPFCLAHLLLIISLGARKKKNVDTKQLYSNFWIEEMKDSASGRWREFQHWHPWTGAVNRRFWQVTECVLLKQKLFTEASFSFK